MRMMWSGSVRAAVALALLGSLGLQAFAQQTGAPQVAAPLAAPTSGPLKGATPAQLAGIAKDNARHFGDDPDDGGPMATDLSPELKPAAVLKPM